MTGVLDWRPTASRQQLVARAALLAALRRYFADADVLEVETPLLSTAAVPDIHLDSFQLEGESQPRYLHTSPEYPMKRLLAAGSGSIFQICKVFRAGELGRRHNPEFTMLEWYRVGFDMNALIADVEALVRAVMPSSNALPAAPFPRITYQEAFLQAAGIDPLTAAVKDMQNVALAKGVNLAADALGEQRDGWLQCLMTHVVEPYFAELPAWFVTHFPATQAALAQLDAQDARVAQRFEFYMRGVELANGYHELTDAQEQRRRFSDENQLRRANSKPTVSIDERFLAALEAGMPACSGVALGLDRLLMQVVGTRDIRDVMAFPWDVA